ncbi:putative disease resistance protein RGA3 [Salvia hispanica]|uniref:putative disease resistance protein RGA3 n=1 Tax=Salvia hispanica TaxID=49212 RepID=UPI0020091F90|nr:putative disease resistance protein RGA3 [Salvia hispanica]
MEGEAAAAALQVLVQNLVDHTKKEFSLVRGLNKEAAKLTKRLGTLQEFLNDAEKRTIPGGAVKSWLKKLEDVAFDADNVLDEFNYRLLSKKNKPMKQKVLSCFSSSCVNISRSRSMALRIQEIDENLESINKEATELGLKETLATNVPTLATFETDSFTLDPIFIGRDDVVSEIVEILTTSIKSDERLISILAIVGMGGLGKTTLTRKVFHLLKEKNLFGSHIWVHVSQIFDPIVLFNKILKALTSPNQVEIGSREGVLEKLQQVLKDKTYFLILDDVWNEDRPTWDCFINSLLGVSSIKGNVIVVTTRSMEVASTVSAIHIHKLEGLSKDDCWSIIKERTFGKEKVPLRFEAIGTEIAQKCQGLPLAASVVGGVLRDKKSEEKWRSIKENWLSSSEGDYITKILKLSFDNLSLPSLKKCFAYCSIFPKGRRIERQKLIEYWMAEGFLVADGSSDMESMGDKFINVLTQKSLLQTGERDPYVNVENCVMHDLVHDLASSVLAGSHNADGINPVRYMFFEEKSSDVLKQTAKYLRTLLSIDNICGNMFSDFKCLHILTFGSYEGNELPSSIMKLIHLRVLDIEHSRIIDLPDWIGKLVHLQTLRTDNYFTRKLPITLKYLTNLRHLYIGPDAQLPGEIGRLTSLQTLEYFQVGDKDGWKIEELGSLNGLKGYLQISKLEKVTNKEETEKASLLDKSKLLNLCLRWDQTRKDETTNDENVLDGLQPHPNLKRLWIEGFKGKRFPSWTQKMEVEKVRQTSCVPLNNLIEVGLYNCFECEEIPIFGQLPNLMTLRLEGLWNVKSISSSFYGLEKRETCIVFPSLKKLELRWMIELAEWAEVESEGASGIKVFPKLQYLKIELCPKLKGLPNGTCNLNLKELIIYRCLNLKGLPNGICTLNSLKTLQVGDCPNLEWLVEDIGVQQSQGSLECLMISECSALQYFPCEIIGSSLHKLLLENISNLKNLPGIIGCLPKSPHLKFLKIVGIPQFMTTCFVEIPPSFSSLEMLELDASMGGSMESVDALLQACRSSSHSLTSLTLKGIQGGWENLVESLQHLTALKCLELETIGMEKLPKWLSSVNESRQHQFHKGFHLKINGEDICEFCWILYTIGRTTYIAEFG